MRHSSYHTPSLPSRIGRVLLVLLCSAGVLSGGFLLLCGLGVLSPAAISQQVSAWLHPPAASTPASAPAEDLSLPEENDPFKRGEIRKQAKSLKSSRLWTAGKQVTTE